MNNLLTNKSYALIEKNQEITLYEGDIKKLSRLQDLEALQNNHSEIIFINPYSSIKEKEYKAHGNDPIIALLVENKKTYSLNEINKVLPDKTLTIGGITTSLSDENFAEKVQEIKTHEIDTGNATQVILSRYFNTQIKDFSELKALSLYKKALGQHGQYMTFLFVDKSEEKPHYFIGTPPERHVEITKDTIGMTPIAGTLKKTTKEDFPKELEDFLNDPKEIQELFQVLDEEIKIMAHICPKGGRVKGPYLREIGGVVHTEYELEGSRNNNPIIDIFTHTLHAPTLIGGPLESAARIIHRHETESRRYYGGELGILKNDTLDSAILIRCAEISGNGMVRVQAGAGIVSGSVPEKEMEETRAKASVFLRLLTHDNIAPQYLTTEREASIQPVLQKRNEQVSSFLFAPQEKPSQPSRNRRITIINNEDNFAEVISHILQNLGYDVTVLDTFDFDMEKNRADVVILGPGPGDINDMKNPRMKKLHEITTSLFEQKTPLLGICLGHQSILKHHHYSISQLERNTQGVQKEIDVFGSIEKVGFYNSFAPQENNAPVLTFHKEHHIGLQFHPESVMTPNGQDILEECLTALKEERQPNLSAS